MRLAIFGKRSASWLRTWFQVVATVGGSGWAKMVRKIAATMSVWVLGTWASRVAGEVNPAALVGGALEAALQRGDEPGVLIAEVTSRTPVRCPAHGRW